MKYGDLTGKVAVITGGGSGIGRATCKMLAECGATVVAADINLEGAQQTAHDLTANGLKAVAMQVDVVDISSVKALVESTLKSLGSIDILVTSAGIVDATKIPDMTIDRWDRLIDINLRGTFLCMQAVASHMMEKRSGKIITISSQAGQFGGYLAGVNYTASKGGVIAMCKAFARHCAPYNVNVNDVSPGIIATELIVGRGDKPSDVPIGRLGTALDVAKAVYFLASDLSDYITGCTVDVNGGMLMRS